LTTLKILFFALGAKKDARKLFVGKFQGAKIDRERINAVGADDGHKTSILTGMNYFDFNLTGIERSPLV
jgi:hypothetical protein